MGDPRIAHRRIKLIKRKRHMTYALTLTSHKRLNSIAPLLVVLGLFMSFGISLGFVDLIKGEIGGIVNRLKNVETNIARLLAGILMIVEGNLNEILNALGLHVNYNRRS